MSPVFRWGVTLPIILAVLAVAYRLQQQQPLADPNSTAATHYCYESVRTQDADRPAARCFSVADGEFTAVWTEAGAGAGADQPATTTTTTAGHVIPGLWDGHGHLLQYGEFLHSVDLFGSQTLDDTRARVKKYMGDNPGAGSKENWIRGVGWDQTLLGRMPTAADMEQDDSLKGIYMMLDRVDVHCIWVSQSVLALLPPDLPRVMPGGEIITDPGPGVFCDNAMDLVVPLYPQPDAAVKARHVRSAMRALNAVGLVGMHDAGATPKTLSLYADLAEVGSDSEEAEDDWTLRVYSMFECDARNAYCPDDAVKISRPDARLNVRSVKLFADGALGSWGSAMLEPYADRPETSGSMLVNASALTRVAKQWAADGYQVNIHAIGDLANRLAMDALEAALDQQCPPSSEEEEESPQDRHRRLSSCQSHLRFRIEHAQIIHPLDQARLAALSLLPSIQPTHATSDMAYALARLGPSRLTSSAYRMRSLLAARPVLGSDFPVEPPNPLHGIYAAVARRSPATGRGADGGEEGWHLEEALTMDEALWGFTGAPAYGGFLEGRAGVIKEGALADWVVLDRPFESLDVEDLRTLTVKETWVAGKRVYVRPSDE